MKDNTIHRMNNLIAFYDKLKGKKPELTTRFGIIMSVGDDLSIAESWSATVTSCGRNPLLMSPWCRSGQGQAFNRDAVGS